MNKGYIAITSAIIISAMLMAVVFSVSASGFFRRANVVGALLKAESRALADACASKALLGLSENRAYAGNETITLGAGNCAILPISGDGGDYVIKTSSSLRGTITNLKIKARGSDLAVLSWKEVASF